MVEARQKGNRRFLRSRWSVGMTLWRLRHDWNSCPNTNPTGDFRGRYTVFL